MLRYIIRIILAIVCIGIALWQSRLLLAQFNSLDRQSNPATMLVKKSVFTLGIARQGQLESTDVQTIYGPRMDSDMTLTWVIEDGTHVKKGDVVARVDTSKYRFEVEAARLDYLSQTDRLKQQDINSAREVQAAEQGIDRAKTAVDVSMKTLNTEKDKAQAQREYESWKVIQAQKERDRQYVLRDLGIVATDTADQSEQSLRSQQFSLTKADKNLGYMAVEHEIKKRQVSTDITSAQLAVELAKRSAREGAKSAKESAERSGRLLKEREENLASGDLKAPQDGVVMLATTWDDEGNRRTFREGDRLRWGGQPICYVTKLSQLQVQVHVDQAAASKVKVGQEALISVAGVTRKEFKGKVVSIGAVARRIDAWDDPDAKPDERTFDVTIRLPNPDTSLLRPGIKARVKIIIDRVQDVISIPRSAVFEKPDLGQVVYMRNGNGFKVRKVTTGQKDDDAVIILKGLHAGDRITLTDPTSTGDGND